MDIKATIDKESFGYRNRLLLIALGAMLYAAWCLYDALVAYPDKIAAHEAFNRVKIEHPEDWRQTEWPKVATANNWDPTKEPDEKTNGDILTQWLQFGIVFPIGVFCLFSVITWSRKYIGVDGNTLYANGGVEVPFDQITRIDAARWENKGIAKVYYDIGSGESNVLIDDFKFERLPADAIFNRLKEAVDDEKMEGLSDASDSEVQETEPQAM
jgi:hypothetical protein